MKNKSEILIKFGDRVREIRTHKGLSQEQLAHLADVHRTYIGMIERGERNLSLKNIEKLAEVFKMTVSKLLDL